MSKDHNTITCTHGKGLACPVCYEHSEPQQGTSRKAPVFITDEQTLVFDSLSEHLDVKGAKEKLINSLYQCGDACNCMKCNPSKSFCIALCGPAIPVKPDTTDYISVPQPERFSDLPEGTEFYIAMTYAYGSRLIITKIAEDKQLCNAVYSSDARKVRIEGYQQVIRA